jgi:hypothetical protein
MLGSILSGIVAFLLWCVTDTSLKRDHVRNPNGEITIWGVLSIVLVQIVLWTMVGFFAVWILPHLPQFLLTGWRFPITIFGSSILQWFALLMILQYVWTITRTTLSTAVVAVMAKSGSQRAKKALDEVHKREWSMEMERKLSLEQRESRKEDWPSPDEALGKQGENCRLADCGDLHEEAKRCQSKL